ncbi:uncharacterized protein [Montipora capricornis]|uniref:uncharacterized protein n=1 Tax=Montipora capricornis TaxID=246305 RepID=UPI0035F16CB8
MALADGLPASVLLWSDAEAEEKQVKQLGTSACGATAVLNVLKLLGKAAEPNTVIKEVNTRLRDLDAPLPQYLLSRSVAGTTHQDLLDGLNKLTNGDVIGRFFHMYPERDFDLSKWLRYWLLNGAVPLATLNCQKVPLCTGMIPDAWHHQVIYGVSEKGLHLINPQEVSSFGVISKQLCSESVLLIRRDDVLQRWSNTVDYSCWNSAGTRWNEFDVRGQIDHMIKQETLLLLHGREIKHRELLMTHITIPAAYKSGITLFALKGSKADGALQDANELPLLMSSCTSEVQNKEDQFSCKRSLAINV